MAALHIIHMRNNTAVQQMPYYTIVPKFRILVTVSTFGIITHWVNFVPCGINMVVLLLLLISF